MIYNINDLIAEARKWATKPDDYVEDDLLVRLSDALEATVKEMHVRELHHFEEEKLRADAEAERDRYHDIARRTELQCQDAEAEAALYRAAIRDALDVKMFKVGMHSYGDEYQVKVQRILAQALKGES